MQYTLGLVLLAAASVLGAENEFFVSQKISFSNETAAPKNTEWEWDFGDGKKSADKNATHSYEEPGDYQVVLTVKAPNVQPRKSSPIPIKVIPIEGLKEKLTLEIPGDGVLYVGQKYLLPNPVKQDPRLSFEWDLGNDNKIANYAPEHRFIFAGTNNVQLNVSVKDGKMFSVKGALVVKPVEIKPLIETRLDLIKPNRSVSFRAGTKAPEELLNRIQYTWTFTGPESESQDSPTEIKIQDQSTVEESFGEPGIWTVSLEALFNGIEVPKIEGFTSFEVISTKKRKDPKIKRIDVEHKTIGQDGKYVAKILVETEGDYEELSIKIDEIVNDPAPQKKVDAIETEEKSLQHVFNIPLDTPMASYAQKEVKQQLRVLATITSEEGRDKNSTDSNASKDLSQAMEFTLNLIPPKPDWVLWAYLGGGLLVLIIIGIIALRFVRTSG